MQFPWESIAQVVQAMTVLPIVAAGFLAIYDRIMRTKGD
jgi:hypothetical protein